MKTAHLRGFTLIELLVAICIIAVISTIIILILNPGELVGEGRDSIRLQDLSNLEKTINYALQENPESPAEILCYQLSAPCLGNSLESSSSARAIDGTGWVKVNLSVGFSTSILPIDPVNDISYFYSYQTNITGTKWEIDAKLESAKYNYRMQTDNGNNPQLYEIGSDKNILP